MIYRILPALCFLSGFILLGFAAFANFVPVDGPGLSINEPEREFPTQAAKQRLDVVFHLQNPTGHTVRIVGLAEC